MKLVFNNPVLKPRRQQLRNKSTESESILWEKLRNRKLGYKFTRQYSIEGYVIDFYCSKARLAIELEGSIHNHPNVKIYDNYRKKHLEEYRINFLVFNNSEIHDNLEAVILKIQTHLPLLD
jgi:cyclase